MPWFYCDSCGDTIKKPKLMNHCSVCSAHSFTCIDCSRTFDRRTAQGHSTCVTEHEKYALGATKPGGYASQGFFGDGKEGAAGGAKQQPPAGPVGTEFLSERAPWKCSICNVSCTSQDTLLGHAQGAKHVRRSRAAIAARDSASNGAAAAATADAGGGGPAANGAAAAANGAGAKEAAKEDAGAEPAIAVETSAAGDAAANGEGSAGKKDKEGKPKKKKEGAKRKRQQQQEEEKKGAGGVAGGEPQQQQQQIGAEAAAEAAAAVAVGGGKEGNKRRKNEGKKEGKKGKAEDVAPATPDSADTAAVVPAAANGAAGGGKSIKWKALTSAALKKVQGGTMKVSKLQKQVLKAAGLKAKDQDAATEMLATLQKSSKFEVAGGSIKLRAE